MLEAIRKKPENNQNDHDTQHQIEKITNNIFFQTRVSRSSFVESIALMRVPRRQSCATRLLVATRDQIIQKITSCDIKRDTTDPFAPTFRSGLVVGSTALECAPRRRSFATRLLVAMHHEIKSSTLATSQKLQILPNARFARLIR